nr:hypothetical protein [Tanacetum cinerariifolium]
MDHQLVARISLAALLCFILLVSSNLANATNKLTTTQSQVYVASWCRKILADPGEGDDRDDGHVRGLEDDEKGLFDMSFKLESSFDVLLASVVEFARSFRLFRGLYLVLPEACLRVFEWFFHFVYQFQDDMLYSCLAEYLKHFAMIARIKRNEMRRFGKTIDNDPDGVMSV